MVKVKVKLRNKTLDHFQRLFPNIPPYVLKTLVYENFHHAPEKIKPYQTQFESGHWTLKEMDLTKDSFTPQTQLSIRMRRHLLQRKEIRKDSYKHDIKYLHMKYEEEPYKEPLVLSKRPDGYEIYSGWHQAVLSFELWPNGFTQNCWIEANPIFT